MVQLLSAVLLSCVLPCQYHLLPRRDLETAWAAYLSSLCDLHDALRIVSTAGMEITLSVNLHLPGTPTSTESLLSASPVQSNPIFHSSRNCPEFASFVSIVTSNVCFPTNLARSAPDILIFGCNACPSASSRRRFRRSLVTDSIKASLVANCFSNPAQAPARLIAIRCHSPIAHARMPTLRCILRLHRPLQILSTKGPSSWRAAGSNAGTLSSKIESVIGLTIISMREWNNEGVCRDRRLISRRCRCACCAVGGRVAILDVTSNGLKSCK